MIPLHPLLVAYLVVFVFSTGFRLALEAVNAGHVERHKGRVPDAFKGVIDHEDLAKMDRYTMDRIRFSSIESVAERILFLALLLSGVLPWLAQALQGQGFVGSGLIFFAVPAVIFYLFDLPFDSYRTFTIEARYGFNTSTRKLWVLDHLKSTVIAVVLGGLLLGLFLLMVAFAGSAWWVWAWAILMAFQILMLVIYPTVIAPLFNKFSPVQDEALKELIRALAREQGVAVKDIHQMDAGRRSRHTNAYFTGVGRVKRIVLYDTLLQSHEPEEILAVLAHEMGHLKKGHVWKQILIFGGATLVLLFAASQLMQWEVLYRAFGFSVSPAYAGLFLAGVLWEPVGFFLSPLSMALSRRFEREADRFAHTTSAGSVPLVRALKKMARDNLANLRPHPLYVRFHYSHPPLLERIRTLESLDGPGTFTP
jgi:STE24 endopeptidase